MRRLISLFFLISILLGQSASLWAHVYKSGATAQKKVQKVSVLKREPKEPIVVRVTGYGAFEKAEDAKSESKRLMAIRASKLDAYRALAERIYGTGISGTSTVQDFVLKHDGFGVVVDSVIRGARVVSISENKGAGFETVLELLVPGDFSDCLNKVNNFNNGSSCLRPLPQFNSYQSDQNQQSKQQPQNKMGSLYFLN